MLTNRLVRLRIKQIFYITSFHAVYLSAMLANCELTRDVQIPKVKLFIYAMNTQ